MFSTRPYYKYCTQKIVYAQKGIFMPKPKKIQVDNQGVLDLIGIRTVIESYLEIYNKSQSQVDPESLERRKLILDALTRELPALIESDKTKQAPHYTESLQKLVNSVNQDVQNLEDSMNASSPVEQDQYFVDIKTFRDIFVEKLEAAKISAKQRASGEQKQALLAMVKHYDNGHIHSAQRKESAKELKAFIKTLSLPEDYSVFIEKLNEIRQKTFQADAERYKSEASKTETKTELSFTARMKHFAKQKYQARHKDLKEAMAPLLGGRFQKLLSDLHEESVKKMTMAKGVTPEFKVFSIEFIDLRSMLINIDSSMATNITLKSAFDLIKKDCTEMRFADAQEKLEKFLNDHEKELSNYQINQIKQAEIKLSNIVRFVKQHPAVENMVKGSQAQLGKGLVHQILSGYKSPYTWFPGQAITISEESIASYAATLMHVTSPKEIFAEVAKEIVKVPDEQKAEYYQRFQNFMREMVVADTMPQHIIKGANKENFRAIAKIEKDIASKEKAMDTKQKALAVLDVFNAEKITHLLQDAKQIASSLQSRKIQLERLETEIKAQPDVAKKQSLEILKKEIKALETIQEITKLKADSDELSEQLSVRKQSEALYSELIENYNGILFDHVPYQAKLQKLISEVDDKIKAKESQIQLKETEALLKEKAQLESQKLVYEKNLQAIMPQVEAMNSMLASLYAAGLDVSKFADSMQKALQDKQNRAENVQALRMQVQAAGTEKKSLNEILQTLPTIIGTEAYNQAKKMVADSLRAQSISDLMSIRAYEFLNQNWSKEETKQNSELVKNAIANFNRMSTMIVADILQAPSAEAKEQCAVFYSEIMMECIKNKDFNSAMAIMAALNNVQIERLDLLGRRTFVGQNQLNLNITYAGTLFAQQQQSEYLREVTDGLLERGLAVVPFTGPYLSVLTAKDEEPDTLKDPNTADLVINEAKMQKIHVAMSAVLRAQEQILKDPDYRPTQLVEIAQRARQAPSEEEMWPVIDAAMVKIELDLGKEVKNDAGEKIAQNIFELIESKLKTKDFPEYFRIILKDPGKQARKVDQEDAYKMILEQLPFAAMQMDVASVDRMLSLIEKMHKRAEMNNESKKLDDSLENLFSSTRDHIKSIQATKSSQKNIQLAPTTAIALEAVVDFNNALESYQLAKRNNITNQITYYEQQLKGPLKVKCEKAIRQLKEASKTGALSEETAQAINPILKSISTHPVLSALKLKDLQGKAEFIVQAGQNPQSVVDMQGMMHTTKPEVAKEPVVTQIEAPLQSRTLEDIAEITSRTGIKRSASMSDVRGMDLSAALDIKQSFIEERKQALAAQAAAHPKISDEMRVALYQVRDNVEQEIAQIKAKAKILENIDTLNTQLENATDAKTQEEIAVDLKKAKDELNLIRSAESRLAKLEILEKRIEDVQADFTLEKANKIIVDYKRISQEKDALVKPVEPSAQRLAIAEYVARNIPVWTVATDNLPDRGKGAETVKVAKVMAGTLITETIDMPLVKGQMFWYASKDIQGLTPATASGNPPTLFGTMAPDQYLLADNVALNSDPQAIDALANALTDLIVSKREELVTAEDRIALNDRVKSELMQADLKFKDPTDSKLWDNLSRIASNHGGSIAGRADAQKISPALQSIIGKKHVTAIADSVGVGDPKQYAVLTIIGADGSEAKGFGLQQATVLSNAKMAKVSTFAHGDVDVPTISLYQGHDSHIERQLVLQSNGSVQNAQGQAVPGKLNFANSDLAHLLDFYHATMGRNPPIPVAVNCTDGIDRTGMTMVALMMLNAFAKNDFTAMSSAEQQKILINMIDGLKQDRGPFFLKGIEDTAIAVAFGYALITAQKQLDFEKDLQSEVALDSRIKALLTDKIVAEPDKLLTALKLLSREPDLSQKDSQQLNKWIELVADRTHAYEQFSIINNPKSELSKKIDAIPKGPVSSHGSSALKGLFELEKAPISHFIKLLDADFDLNTIRYQGKGIHELAIERVLADPSDENLAELKAFSDKSGKEGQEIMQNYLEEKGYPKDLVQTAKNGNDIQHAMLANPKRYVEIAEKVIEKEKKDLVTDFVQPVVRVPPQKWASVKPTALKDVPPQSQQSITLGTPRKSMTLAHAAQSAIASPGERMQVTIVNDQQLLSKVIKFSEIQSNRDKDPKIVQVTQLKNDSDTVNGVMIGFENAAKPERPLKVYTCEEKGQTTFSVSRNLPPDSAKQAILAACLLAVRNASPNAVFTIPESASKEKADMIKECFIEAIKKEKHSFPNGQEPKIESKSSPVQALKHK